MTRAEELVAELEGLPPDQVKPFKGRLRALLQRQPRDEYGLTPLDRAYVDALMVYKLAIRDGVTANEAFQLAVNSSSEVKGHSFSFKKIVEGNRRDLHTVANLIGGRLRERPFS